MILNLFIVKNASMFADEMILTLFRRFKGLPTFPAEMVSTGTLHMITSLYFLNSCCAIAASLIPELLKHLVALIRVFETF